MRRLILMSSAVACLVASGGTSPPTRNQHARIGLAEHLVAYTPGGAVNVHFNFGAIDPTASLFPDYRVWERPLLSGTAHELPAPPPPRVSADGGTFDSASWSPDGEKLALSAGQGGTGRDGILLLAADGRYVRVLNPRRARAYGGAWAVDGDEIPVMTGAYRQYGSEELPVVYGLAPKGSIRQVWPPRGLLPGSGRICGPDFVSDVNDTNLAALLLERESLPASNIEWSIRHGEIVYSTKSDCHWRGARIGSTDVARLPFAPFNSSIAMNSEGLLAGRLPDGRVSILSANFKTLHVLGRGYGPVWSQDGAYLFYITRMCGKVRYYRIQTPDRLSGERRGHTTFCSSRVMRVKASGSAATIVTRQNAFGFADLNILMDDKTVVFTRIPNEYRLWRNRGHLRLRTLAQYSPRMDIEIATMGSKPRVLIANAHLPEVQPAS